MHRYGKADGGAPFISVDCTVESSALYQRSPSQKYVTKWPLMKDHEGATSLSPMYATCRESILRIDTLIAMPRKMLFQVKFAIAPVRLNILRVEADCSVIFIVSEGWDHHG